MPANFRALLWSQLAQEARSAAKQIKNPELKLQVLLVAARYLAMARRAENLDTPPKNLQSLEIIDSIARNPDDGGQNGGQDAASHARLRTVIQATASPRRQHQGIVHDDQPSLRRRDPTTRTWRRTDRLAID